MNRLRIVSRLLISGLLAAPLAVAALSQTVFADTCDTDWVNPVDGFWGDSSKWSNGVPNGNGGCITVAGTYTVTVGVTPANPSYLKVGGSSGVQTLLIDGGSAGTSLSLQDNGGAISVINANGRVVLTNTTANNGAAVFHAPSGANFNAAHITNNGIISVIDGSATAGAQRYLTGSIINNGTIQIYRDTTMNTSSTQWVNSGTLDLGSGDTLTFADTGCGGCRPTFVNDTGGVINGSGTFFMDNIRHSVNGFFQGAGTIASTANVILNSSSLHYTGSGAGKITVRGNLNELTGNMAAGQELVIEAVDNGTPIDAKISADQNTTGAGTVRLTHAGTGVGGAAIFEAALFGNQTFTNTGTIISEDGVGGSSSTRSLRGNIASSGTITINRDTSVDRSSSVLTNTGTLTLGSGKTLTFVDTSCGGCRPTFVNGTGGAINGSGTLMMNGSLHANNGFFQGAGTIATTASVILNSSSLHYTGSGAGKITVRGNGNVMTGNMAAGQELVIEAVDNGTAVDAKISADQNTTGAGTVRLTHSGSGTGGAAIFEAAMFGNQTFTNSGTIISEDGVGGTSSTRSLRGNIASSGTITINRDTSVDRSSSVLTNTGTLTLGSGDTLTFVDTSCGGCRPTFVNGTGGAINGSGTLFMDGSLHAVNGFFQGGGTIANTASVILRNSSLHYTGSGAGKITVRGNLNELTGDMAAGQELVIQATHFSPAAAEDAKIRADQNTTGAGTVRLTHAGSGADGNAIFEAVLSGAQTFTNSGSIISEDGVGGASSTRSIQGNIANSGTITISRDTAYNRSSSTLTNTGTLSLSSGDTFTFVDTGCGGCRPTFVNGAGGSISGSGTLLVDGIRGSTNGFFQGGGTIANTASVILHNSSLHYTGSGAGKIVVRGTQNDLDGSIAAGQELLVERANGEDAFINDDSPLTNAGTITLAAGTGSASLRVNSGQTLTNNGTIRGTGTIIAGTLSNAGNVSPGASPGTLNVSGNYTQTSAGTLAVEIGGLTAGTQHDRLAVSGAVSLAGTLAISQANGFVPANGDTVGILTHASASGAFGTVTGANVGGKIYTPAYSATTTNLVASQGSNRQPDGLINVGTSAFVGSNIYNLTGLNQTKTGTAKIGSSKTFKIKIQNDGTAASDRFLVLATGSNVNGYTITFKKGTKNITAAVLAGTWQSALLAPGSSVTIKAIVRVVSGAALNSQVSRLVTITSVNDSAKKDAVMFIGKRQ